MDRTLPPTPRRLRRALREGDSPLSAASVRAVVLLAAAAFVPALGRALRTAFAARLSSALQGGRLDAASLAWDVLLLATPLVAVAAVTAIAVSVAQTGGFVAPGRLSRGIRLGAPSRARPYEAVRAGAVVLVVVAVSLWTLATAGEEIALGMRAPEPLLDVALHLADRWLGRVALALLVAAAIDVVVQRVTWQRRHRMSPREVADERRETEGAPELRRARRAAHAALHSR